MASNSTGRLHYEHPSSSGSSAFIDVAPRILVGSGYRSTRKSAAIAMHVVRTGKRTQRKLTKTHWHRRKDRPWHRRTPYVQHHVATANQCDVGQGTIDILPENVLLEIFDFYLSDAARIDAWHKLVHVCQKWRNVVFGSPHRLDLRLYCSVRTPTRKMLNIWPELPIFVCNAGDAKWGMDNIFATFEHTDRIYKLILRLHGIPGSQSEKVLAQMQRPFPALTYLFLGSHDKTPPVVPASFLGGCAPLLRTLHLYNISFPKLPKLLSSATHLSTLETLNIPYSGHLSPEVLITCLSATRLESLIIGFESPRSRAGRKSRHPPPRTLLPFLTTLKFNGVCEYLEDLVARIDAPLLDSLKITFFHQLIFVTPQLAQLICRAPKLKAQNGARVGSTSGDVQVILPQTTSYKTFELRISCSQSDWQLSSLAQVCGSSFPQALIHTVKDLYIFEDIYMCSPAVPWQDDLESNQWLELLHPFTAVKDLILSWDFTRHIAPALQELVGERTMEVLPALQTLSIEVPGTLAKDEPIPSEISFPSRLVQESIERFVAARELAGHTITVRRFLDKNGSDE